MNQAIDYGQMARMLMMNPQLVGDLVRGPKRWFTGETPAPQLLGPTGGGGSRGPSQWRTQEGVSAYEAQSGLRPGTLSPVNPNRGEIKKFSPARTDVIDKLLARSAPKGNFKPFNITPTGAPRPYTPQGRVNRDMDLVEQQWHHNTPNMNKALEKLTPAEINKLFDALFKAPPGVEFP